MATAETSGSGQLGTLDRMQPLLLIGAIAIGLTLAELAPGIAARLGWLVSVGVFALIYLIMLGVHERNILKAFRQRRPMIIALGLNFVFTPILAYGLGWLFLSNHPEIWVGLILYLVTPCIGWYLVFTDLAGGDIELGVGLLFWNILLQMLLIPVYLWLLAGQLVGVDMGIVLRSVGLFLILPYALAWVTRRFLAAQNGGATPVKDRLPLGLLKTAALMLVIAAMFASQGSILLENPAIILLMIGPGVAFFVVIFVVALAASRMANLTYPQTALVVFTTAARNSEVSLAVAVTAFASPLIALTVVIGPAIELPILILILHVLKRLQAGWSASQH